MTNCRNLRKSTCTMGTPMQTAQTCLYHILPVTSIKGYSLRVPLGIATRKLRRLSHWPPPSLYPRTTKVSIECEVIAWILEGDSFNLVFGSYQQLRRTHGCHRIGQEYQRHVKLHSSQFSLLGRQASYESINLAFPSRLCYYGTEA